MWQVAAATGWSVRYILDGVNYQTLIMMLSDAPRYVGGRKKRREVVEGGIGTVDETRSAEAEAAEVAEFFRSNLKI